MVSLPPLRQELALQAGPVLPDGQPSWTLHDPTRAAFFRLDWLTYEILCRWNLADPGLIAASIKQDTTLHPSAQDVSQVLQFAFQQQWVQVQGIDAIRAMAKQHERRQGRWLQQLIHGYLFFRLPLFKPDALLTRVLPWVNPLFSRGFAFLSGLALLWGLVQINRQWDVFSHQLVDTLSWSGLLAYGLAIIGVKFLHELGHAFTAKRLGCRVPTMGVAFVVMWPMAYTDTNDTWRLHRARDRLRVAIAGIATETLVAIWCTLAWSLLPDGPWRSVAFVLATTSWVATLLINASPFMRFDGYFILSDALDMPNLHQRSFAMARWWLRWLLFGVRPQPPEPATRRQHTAMIAFGVATWLYRLVLFLGIALVVYHFFFKALGVIMLGVELYWFIWKPIQHELLQWHRQRAELLQGGHTRWSALLLLALVAAVWMPWPHRVHVSALLRPLQVQVVSTPEAVQIDALLMQEGQTVGSGAPLLRLHAPELAHHASALRARIQALMQQVNAERLRTDDPLRIRAAQDELNTAQAQWQRLQADLNRYAPTATVGGVVRDLAPGLAPGQWWPADSTLMTIVPSPTEWRVETWVNERELAHLKVGNTAHFWASSLNGPSLSLQVVDIDADATRVLPRPALSTQHGGHIATRSPDPNTLIPEAAVYHVVLAPVSASWQPQQLQTWRGELVIEGEWSAPAKRFAQQALAVLWRELDF